MASAGTATKLSSITCEGFIVRQNDHEMYVTKIKASDLIKIMDVERVEAVAGGQDGYQRPERKARVTSVKEFVKAGNAIPPALILSARTKPRPYGKGWQFTGPLFVVDGQHRAGGLREAIYEFANDPRFANFEFTCVIQVLDVAAEQKLFVDINRGQKPVTNDYTVLAQYNLKKAGRTDLIDEDETLSKKFEWQPKAFEVAMKLNKEGGAFPVANPLFGRINLLNGPASEHPNAVTQGTVVKSLEPVLQNSDIDGRTIGNELVAFWRGVSLTWTTAAVRDFKNHHLLRNLGVQIMHSIFLNVRGTILKLKGDPSNALHWHKVLELGRKVRMDGLGVSDSDWSTTPTSRASMIGGSFRAGGKLFADSITEAIGKKLFSLGTKL